jgi:hypothetical protein
MAPPFSPFSPAAALVPVVSWTVVATGPPLLVDLLDAVPTSFRNR